MNGINIYLFFLTQFIESTKAGIAHVSDDRSWYKPSCSIYQAQCAYCSWTGAILHSRPRGLSWKTRSFNRSCQAQKNSLKKREKMQSIPKCVCKLPQRAMFVWEPGQSTGHVTVCCSALAVLPLSSTVLLILTKLSKGNEIPFRVAIQHLLNQ